MRKKNQILRAKKPSWNIWSGADNLHKWHKFVPVVEKYKILPLLFYGNVIALTPTKKIVDYYIIEHAVILPEQLSNEKH